MHAHTHSHTHTRASFAPEMSSLLLRPYKLVNVSTSYSLQQTGNRTWICLHKNYIIFTDFFYCRSFLRLYAKFLILHAAKIPKTNRCWKLQNKMSCLSLLKHLRLSQIECWCHYKLLMFSIRFAVAVLHSGPLVLPSRRAFLAMKPLSWKSSCCFSGYTLSACNTAGSVYNLLLTLQSGNRKSNYAEVTHI